MVPSWTTALQLTDAGVHNNVASMPGTLSPSKDDRLPGLIVLVPTATVSSNAPSVIPDADGNGICNERLL